MQYKLNNIIMNVADFMKDNSCTLSLIQFWTPHCRKDMKALDVIYQFDLRNEGLYLPG